MNGILNIIKPKGKTSFDIVAFVKKITGVRRVGHAGTLDPLAYGVLPICLGNATRVVEFLALSKKTYHAEVELGITTDTYDADGKIIQKRDSSRVSKKQVEEVLSLFRGSIEQVPPMYSAIKHKGVPLYKLARAGIEIPRKARKVDIFRLDLLDWKPPLIMLEIECGKGTYIRSLAHDIGCKLTCGAYLKNLVRSKYGPFDIDDAITILQLEDIFSQGGKIISQSYLHPLDTALLSMESVMLNKEEERKVRNGQPFLSSVGKTRTTLEEGECEGSFYRAYSSDGEIVAILRFEPKLNLWRPKKVFSRCLSCPKGAED